MTYAKRSGFTMIEIMVVVVIIGLLASFAGPQVLKFLFKGQVSAAKASLQGLKAAVADYKFTIGRYPIKAEGLDALFHNKNNNPKWDGPYIEGQTETPLDPWGQDFIYNSPPEVFKEKYKYFEIISTGDPSGKNPEDLKIGMTQGRNLYKKASSAFTMIELMVVVVLVGLMATMILPRMFRRSPAVEWPNILDEMNNLVSFARQEAISDQQNYRLLFKRGGEGGDVITVQVEQTDPKNTQKRYTTQLILPT